MKDVYFDFGCFAGILSAIIETYPNETFGFLGGEETKSVNLKMSPPLQSAVKSKDKVEFKDKRRYEEAKDVIDAFGLTIIGGYHSHPKGIAYPSEEDKISAGLENLNKRIDPTTPLMDEWLEIVVSLKKKKYMKNFRPIVTLDDSSKKIEGTIKIQNNGYDFEMIGFWVKIEEIKYNELYVHVPGVANLNIARETFPKTWEI